MITDKKEFILIINNKQYCFKIIKNIIKYLYIYRKSYSCIPYFSLTKKFIV